MRTLLIAIVGLVVLNVFLLSHPGHAEPMFMGLGDLPGGNFTSSARGVSADGSTVVGFSYSTSGMEAFRWTAAGSMVGLGDLDGGDFSSEARAVSADGSTIVGVGAVEPHPGEDYAGEAFRWTAAGEMEGLGYLTAGAPTAKPGLFPPMAQPSSGRAEGTRPSAGRPTGWRAWATSREPPTPPSKPTASPPTARSSSVMKNPMPAPRRFAGPAASAW